MSETKRIVHLLTTTGTTRCGLGGARSSTEDPAQATCKSCIRSITLAATRQAPAAAEPRWHDDWTEVGRDGDGNLILRYEPTGGLYRILPIEET